jgi:hypothetical protein
MARASTLPEARLKSLYEAEGFGGERTMRAKVIRELIDEIHALRAELETAISEVWMNRSDAAGERYDDFAPPAS